MKVLVPVDGSKNSQYAVRFVARHFAEIQDRPTIVLYTAVVPLLPQQAAQIGHAGLDDYYKTEAQHALEPAMELLDNHKIPYETAYDVDWVSDALAARANSGDYSLIVMASRGLSEFKSLIFGSVTVSVLSKTKVPLILVRGEHSTGNKTRRIAIAIDDSDTAVDVVQFVLRTQALFGDAEYHLIHVVRDLSDTMMQRGTLPSPPLLTKEERTAVENVQFEKAISRVNAPAAGLNGEVLKVKLIGNPADAMTEYAHQKNIDMIVMGSHGRSSFATAFIGSVVCRLASQGTVPLFIVR